MDGVILAVDPGTRFGYAVGALGRTPEVGVLNLAQVSDRYAERLWHLGRHLRGVMHTWQPAEVCYEAVYRHAGTTAAHVYGGIMAVVELEAWEAKLPAPRGISPNGAKATAVPGLLSREALARAAKRKGADVAIPNTKVAVLQAMRQKFPDLKIAGFDEADALAIWLTACITRKPC